jgi:hypothetical protein
MYFDAVLFVEYQYILLLLRKHDKKWKASDC